MNYGKGVFDLFQLIDERQRGIRVLAQPCISRHGNDRETDEGGIGVHARKRQRAGNTREPLLRIDLPMVTVVTDLNLIDDAGSKDVSILQAEIYRLKRVEGAEWIDGRGA